MITAANIFAGMPPEDAGAEEHIGAILTRPGLKIERIVSAGQASPEGFWYDQAWDEWVIVLSGSAMLRFEAGNEITPLGPGDYVFIPAHARHRVEWTSPDEQTVWLAVHFSGAAQ